MELDVGGGVGRLEGGLCLSGELVVEVVMVMLVQVQVQVRVQ